MMQSICIAPSPHYAIGILSGYANLCGNGMGTPGHIVASLPDSEASHSLYESLRITVQKNWRGDGVAVNNDRSVGQAAIDYFPQTYKHV
jgi:hypothetical protein